MERQKAYFITCFEKVGTDDLGWLDMGANRVFGFYMDYVDAIEALHCNNLDMHEYLYDYAILEEMQEGIHPDVTDRWFFKYDKEKDGFFEMEEPEEFKHYCNIAIG